MYLNFVINNKFKIIFEGLNMNIKPLHMIIDKKHNNALKVNVL